MKTNLASIDVVVVLLAPAAALAKLTGVAALFAGVDEGKPGKLGVLEGARRWGDSMMMLELTLAVAVEEEVRAAPMVDDDDGGTMMAEEEGTLGTGIAEVEEEESELTAEIDCSNDFNASDKLPDDLLRFLNTEMCVNMISIAFDLF